MKKVFLITSIFALNAYADNSYVFVLPNTTYNKSLSIDKKEDAVKINPVCGISHLKEFSETPTSDLCEKGNSSNILLSNNIFNWRCSIEERTVDCNATKTIDTSVYSSCKTILQENPSFAGQNGIYDISLGGLKTQAYCDMTYQGGGWTLVTAQFESNPVEWNSGVAANYNPNVSSKVSFAFNNSQIPTHTQFAVAQDNEIFDYFDYVYSSGNINHSHITSKTNATTYHIYRNTNGYPNWQHPNYGWASPVQYIGTNVLTITHTNNDNFWLFTFAARVNTQNTRGFGMKGALTISTLENYGWTLFVR